MSGVKCCACRGSPKPDDKRMPFTWWQFREGLFCRPVSVQALCSLWGRKLCLTLLLHGKQKCVPAAPQLRESEKEGAVSVLTS